jgi:mono/diheme cytochrome c family protein
MAQVISESLQYLSLSDLQAIAEFLKSISSPGYYHKAEKAFDSNLQKGLALYMNQCASCHKANGLGLPGAYPPFFKNPVVSQDSSLNLIEVLLHGIPAQYGYEAMPSFDQKLSDEEIAAVANFIRVEWGSAQSPNVTAKMVREKRKELRYDGLH